MASEIRVDKINSLSGVGTVTLSPTGVDIAGITTAATLRATTGIVTSLTAGSLTSLDSTESNSATTGAVTIAGGLGVVKNIYTSGAAYVEGSGGLTVNHDVSIADKIIHTGDTNTAIRFPAADTITAETGGSERIRIISSGEVSIGGFTPTASAGVLQISGGLRVAGSASASDTTTPYIYRTSGSDHLNFATSGVERVRIASDGDIGIGTITPQNNARLQVSTSNQVVAAFEGTGGSDPQIYIGDDMTTPTDNVLVIGYDKADNRGYLTVGGDADTVFQVKNGGDIEIGVGNLKFGTAGKGIDFSATSDPSSPTQADSEVLDNYEEGTWTPGISGSTSITGHSYSSRNGFYTRIGDRVYCDFSFVLSAKGTISGTYIKIVNLPYAIDGNSYTRSVSTPIYFRHLNNKWCFLALQGHEGQNSCYIYGVEGSGSGDHGSTNRSYPDGGDITNITEMTASFSYLAA